MLKLIPRFPTPDTSIPAKPAESSTLIRHPRRSTAFQYEPSSRWVRGVVGSTAVVDSRHQILVWEPGAMVAEYAYPESHVRGDLLRVSKNDDAAREYWRPKCDVEWYDLVVGDRAIPNAAWKWKTPGLEGYIALTWFTDKIKWFEEDEAVFAHPRSPFARIDVLPSSRQVRVLSDGVVLAESTGAVALFESGLPTRFYLSEEDVHWETLVQVDLETVCPYKGRCDKYWRTRNGSEAIAWRYDHPAHQVSAIQGRVAFYNEKVELLVDGVPFVDSPETWA